MKVLTSDTDLIYAINQDPPYTDFLKRNDAGVWYLQTTAWDEVVCTLLMSADESHIFILRHLPVDWEETFFE